MVIQVDVKEFSKAIKELSFIYYGQVTVAFSHLAEVIKATPIGLFVRNNHLFVSYVVPYKMHGLCSIVRLVCDVVVPEPFCIAVTVRYGDLVEAVTKVKKSLSVILLEFLSDHLRIDCRPVTYLRKGSIPRLVPRNIKGTYDLYSDFITALTKVNRIHTDKKKRFIKATNDNPIWFVPKTGCIITHDNTMQVSYYLGSYISKTESIFNFETFLLRLFEPCLDTLAKLTLWHDDSEQNYITLHTSKIEMTYYQSDRSLFQMVGSLAELPLVLDRRVLLNIIPRNVPVVSSVITLSLSYDKVILSSENIETTIKGVSVKQPSMVRMSGVLVKKALSVISSKKIDLSFDKGLVQISPHQDFSDKFYILFRSL